MIKIKDKFKVGDEVFFIRERDNMQKGSMGIIREIKNDVEYKYILEMKLSLFNDILLHSCKQFFKENIGFYAKEGDLILKDSKLEKLKTKLMGEIK